MLPYLSRLSRLHPLVYVRGSVENHTCPDRTGGEVSYIFYSGSVHFQLLKCSLWTTCVLRPQTRLLLETAAHHIASEQYISGQGREDVTRKGASIKAMASRKGNDFANF